MLKNNKFLIHLTYCFSGTKYYVYYEYSNKNESFQRENPSTFGMNVNILRLVWMLNDYIFHSYFNLVTDCETKIHRIELLITSLKSN